MIEPQAVIDQARQWLGVRYLHQGRNRFGCDCLGFIAGMLHELGSDVFLNYLPRAYGRNPQALLMQGLQALTREIPLELGALVVIQFPFSPHPAHAAIYTGETIIHSYASVGKVVEHGYRGQWIDRTKSTWALPLVMYA